MTKHYILLTVLMFSALTVSAKLPAPNDEAKAKAAEAAAKTAWTDKVNAYKLCQYQDKVAGKYYADAKRNNKETKPAISTPACADPGPFVYPPPAVAAAPATAAPATPGTATATASTTPKK